MDLLVIHRDRYTRLLEYFVEHYFYLIPDDVILIDFYTENGNMDFYMYDEKQKIHVKNNNVEKLF